MTSVTERGSMLYPICALFLVQLSIVVHELGHALAMRAKGVEIKEIGLGIPLTHIPVFRRSYKGIAFVLSPIFAGGYVRITPRGRAQKRTLGYADQALIGGAGVMANIFFAIAILMGEAIPGIMRLSGRAMEMAAIFFAVAGALWVFRSIFCSYLVPLLGAMELVWAVVLAARQGRLGLEGPIAIGHSAIVHAPSLSGAFMFGGATSLLLAATNMIPIPPIDGGNILMALVQKKIPQWEERFMVAGVSVVITLVFIASLHDIGGLFHSAW